MNQEKFRDRRDFMRAAANIAGGALLAPALRGQTPAANAKPTVSPVPAMRLATVRATEELNRPYFLESKSGRLDVTLQCQYSYHMINGDDVYLRTYNGASVGPALSVRPGDQLNIRVANQLPTDNTPCPDMDHEGMNNAPVGVNTTNLHTHGLHISPRGNSDNVFVQVCPAGGCFDYQYQIPSDHPPGTLWYHPHKHGSAAVQVANGMAGALIVRGAIDDFYASRGIEERLFLFQQVPFSLKNGTYTSEWSDVNNDALQPFTLINGQLKPIIRMDAGKVYLWRTIHGGISATIPFSVRNASGAQPLYRVAVDGLTTGTVDQMTTADLAPGNRVDVLVKLPAGTYDLVKPTVDHTRALNLRHSEAGQVLATIIVKSGSDNMPIPTSADMAPFVPPHPTFSSGLPVRPIQLGFADVQGGSGHWHFCAKNDAGTVVCEPYNPDHPLQVVLGDSEQWQVVNTDSYLAHPFHIHVNPFQVVNIEYDQAWLDFYSNKQNIQYNPVTKLPINPLDFVWRDTMLIHPCQKVTFNTKYEDFDGCFVMHCHILRHEDQGMMKQVEILPTRGAPSNCGAIPAGCATQK
jgi:FtsP/CotA-like multicopper oxidase with cupredoxin domain